MTEPNIIIDTICATRLSLARLIIFDAIGRPETMRKTEIVCNTHKRTSYVDFKAGHAAADLLDLADQRVKAGVNLILTLRSLQRPGTTIRPSNYKQPASAERFMYRMEAPNQAKLEIFNRFFDIHLCALA
jgi:hypothetical protein